jgi:hypothetical protein
MVHLHSSCKSLLQDFIHTKGDSSAMTHINIHWVSSLFKALPLQAVYQ